MRQLAFDWSSKEIEDLLKILRYLAFEGSSSERTLAGEKSTRERERAKKQRKTLGCGLSRPRVRKIVGKGLENELGVFRIQEGKWLAHKHSITLKGILFLINSGDISTDSLTRADKKSLAKKGLKDALKDDFIAVFAENDLLSELLTFTLFKAFPMLIRHTNFEYFSEDDIKFRLTAAYCDRLNRFRMYLSERLDRKRKHLKTSLRLNPQTGEVELPHKWLKKFGVKVERKTEYEPIRRERTRWRKKSLPAARFLARTFESSNQAEIWKKLDKLMTESDRRIEEERFLQTLIKVSMFNLNSFVENFSSPFEK